ncbi:MAG: hypothetical protein AAGA55_06465 [Planctomycetota bacterium]
MRHGLALFLLLLVMPACHRAPDAAPTQVAALAVASSNEAAGIEIALEASRDTISTLDRLEVTITVRRPVARSLTLIEPDWEANGWTRTGSTDSQPAAITHERIERRRTVTVEPFLPGTYTIPPAAVQWTDTNITRALQTPTLDVTVESVLTPDDAATLAAPGELMPPNAEPESDHAPTLIISVIVLGGALLLWHASRRNTHQAEQPGTPEIIRRIASADDTSPDTLAALHRALANAEPMPGTADALQRLIARCELARFAPQPGLDSTAVDPREIASAALELIAPERADPHDDTARADRAGSAA